MLLKLLQLNFSNKIQEEHGNFEFNTSNDNAKPRASPRYIIRIADYIPKRLIL